jgi:hypothetical protein
MNASTCTPCTTTMRTVAMMTEARQPIQAANSPPTAPRPSTWLRAALVVVGLAAWFATQSLIGARPDSGGRIGDALLDWTAPAHAWLVEHPGAADRLLIVSSAIIDLLGLLLLGRAIFGPSVRPFLALVILFALRQICQGLCALPPPEGMIWRYPGFPSLLVTYGVSNDLFFSGHTGMAVLGSLELARLGRRWLAGLGLLIVVFEMATVIVLRAHWTMDVFAGAVAALVAANLADRWQPACDRALAGRRS